MLLMPNFLENAVKPKFGELYFLVSFHVSFHVSWANREKRNAGRSRRGGNKERPAFPWADCTTEREPNAYRKCVIFHGDGASYLCYHARLRVGRYIWRGKRRTRFDAYPPNFLENAVWAK